MIGYSFVDDWKLETKEGLVVDNPILEDLTFSICKHSQKNIRGNKWTSFAILRKDYGNQINLVYWGDSTPAEAIILKHEQKEFYIFDEVAKELNDQAKKQTQEEVLEGEKKQKDIHKYLNTIKQHWATYIQKCVLKILYVNFRTKWNF